jgi:hypothetical protein
MTGARHERRATGGGKQRPHTQNTTALWYLRPTNCVHPIHVGNASGVGARGPRCFAYTLPSLAKTQHRDNMLRELPATQRHFCFLSSLGAASMLIRTKGGCGTNSSSPRTANAIGSTRTKSTWTARATPMSSSLGPHHHNAPFAPHTIGILFTKCSSTASLGNPMQGSVLSLKRGNRQKRASFHAAMATTFD